MANYPINPYGQNAQMPEGYPIADNLSTDSAQQALSARQGKKLGDFASTNVAVDTSLVSEVVGMLLGPDDNNKWAKIDILDTTYWSRVYTNYYNAFSNADRIRVPVGAKQLYINNGAPQAVLNKMIEYNFNYTI